MLLISFCDYDTWYDERNSGKFLKYVDSLRKWGLGDEIYIKTMGLWNLYECNEQRLPGPFKPLPAMHSILFNAYKCRFWLR